jgi:hypothetical protein
MDFVEGFLNVAGKSVVLTVVDRFWKFAHFLALSHPYSAASVAKAILKALFVFMDFPIQSSMIEIQFLLVHSGRSAFILMGTSYIWVQPFTLNQMDNSRLSIGLSSCTFDA